MASTSVIGAHARMRRILLALLVILAGYVTTSQSAVKEPETSNALPSVEERQKRLRELDLALPEPPNASIQGQDAVTSEAYQRALRNYYDYRKAGYDHRLRVFEWQLIATKIIFIAVLLLVFAGIYFAAVQFHRGTIRRPATNASSEEEMTEVDLSVKGVKVRSPVLGVIILVISLAFFYLYLVYVYPIENAF